MSVGLFVWQVGGKQRTHIRSILGQRVYSVYSAHGALTTFFQQILSHHWLFSNAPIATGHLRWSISTKLIRMDRCPVKHGWIFRFRSLHPRLISLDSRPRWTWNKNWPAAWWAHVASIRGWRSSQTLLTFQSTLIVLGDGTKQKRIFNSSCNVIANRCNEVL